MSLTRIDEELINQDFYDSLYEAEVTFGELANLILAYVAVFCTCDGEGECSFGPEYVLMGDMKPKTVGDGHILDLSPFKISGSDFANVVYDYDEDNENNGVNGIRIRPRPGICLSPVYIFEDFRDYTLTEYELDDAFQFFYPESADDHKKRVEKEQPPIENLIVEVGLTPVKNTSDLEPIDRLSDYITVKPNAYHFMIEQLSKVASFRLSVFQPLLSACGIGCIRLPIIHSAVWFPDIGVFEASSSAAHRKAMPKFKDLKLKIANYNCEVESKFSVLFDELERKRGIANPSRTKRIESRSPDGNSIMIKTVKVSAKTSKDSIVEKKVNLASFNQPKWSIIMTKKQAAAKLEWSAYDLRVHLAQNSEIAHQVRGSRERWRFDCNDPSFACLPVDEDYNKSLSGGAKTR